MVRAKQALATLMVFWACLGGAAAQTDDAPVGEAAPPASYDFERPVALHALPKALREISGLTLLDEAHLGAIQDEEGKLFVIEIKSGKVVEERRFGKGGDYEGLEVVGERLFVLRSDGKLFEIEDWRAEELSVRVHDTKLTRKNDPEGLAYDAQSNQLLIACKEDAGMGLKHKKAVYAFDLGSNTLLEEPAMVIDVSAFNDASSDHAVNRAVRGLLSAFVDLSGFKPSAIAVDPKTRHRYILSSKRKALVVLDVNGTLLRVWALPSAQFEQPEGIAFLPNGDLVIASEGRRGQATLRRYTEVKAP